MFVINKQIFHLYIGISCLDCPLTPVIFFSVSFVKVLLIQKPYFSDCFQIHTHAETDTGRHGRILRTDLAKSIIDLP